MREIVTVLRSMDERLKRIEHDMATEWLRALTRADTQDFINGHYDEKEKVQ